MVYFNQVDIVPSLNHETLQNTKVGKIKLTVKKIYHTITFIFFGFERHRIGRLSFNFLCSTYS